MTPYLETDVATLYHARAEEVYPHIAPESVSVVWSDGRYGMGKSEKGGWDDGGLDTLADWYAPHITAWDPICAPSATVYLWNTAEGWARLDPVMRAAGWVFRTLIVWDKGIASLAGRIDTESLQTWPDTTEVCGFYQRNAWDLNSGPAQMISHAAGRDDRNWIREWLREEWAAAGLTRQAADDAMGTNGMAGHYFGRSQWELPTWERYQTLAALANLKGPPRERPYLVHPKVWPAGDLRASYDHLRAEYDHLRAEYEAARVPFTCPIGVSNVWSHPQVGGRERLKIDGEPHPCQKPLAFASRAILASTRIGDTILDPFAGTNRIAVACRRLPPDERRHAIGIEMERRWLDAVRPSLVADHGAEVRRGQPSLFAHHGKPAAEQGDLFASAPRPSDTSSTSSGNDAGAEVTP